MKIGSFGLFSLALAACLTPAFGQSSSGVAKKTGMAKMAVHAAASKSSAGAKTVKKRSSTLKKTGRATAAAHQAAPTSDRYKEIQQALAAKGYLKSEPSGVWDAESVTAMRQFQTDRNLDPSGKLTAAALIDLGLGPKTESTLRTTAVPAEAVPAARP